MPATATARSQQEPPLVAIVTPRMLDAGRSAFLRERENLDDLYQYFPTDLDRFLAALYRAMQDVC